jgi:starvation-inducible DNA-binding protein
MNPTLSAVPRARRAETLLQPVLSDLLRLWLHAKHAHWNVRGPQFQALHAMFDALAGAHAEWADRVAERLRALGAPAVAHLVDPVDLPRGELPGAQAVESLLHAVEEVVARVAEALRDPDGEDDPVTQDVLTTLLEGLEHHAWLLRSNR